jgi:hypothetical protein
MDFLSATEANLEGVPGLEVLALAARQDRILIPGSSGTAIRGFAIG